MVIQCYVPKCRSRAIKNCGVSFHKLPLDSGQKAKWLKAIRREEDIKNINLRNVQVCSKHFTSNDFRYAGTSIRIKKNVTPTIFPWCGQDNTGTVGASNGLPKVILTGNIADNGEKWYRTAMPRRCAVGVCTNTDINTKGKGVCFYRFPRNKVIRKVWVQRCQRADKWKLEHSRVCSEHFTEDDYHGDLQAELLNIPTKKKLKDTAIPKLKLSKNNVDIESPAKLERRRPFAKRASKSLLYDIVTKGSEHPEGSDVIVTTGNQVWLPSISQSESSHMIEENENHQDSADIVKTEDELWLPSDSQSETSHVIEENENHEDIVKTENELWMPSISQSESSHMIEEDENHEDIVKTENELWLPSDSQSETSHVIEEDENHEDIVKTENELWMPSITQSDTLHVIEENENHEDIVKTENELWMPSISQSESSHMTKENKYETSAVINENVVWLPSISQSESPQVIEEKCENSAVITGNVVLRLVSVSQSQSSQTMGDKYESLLKKYKTVVKENEEIKRQIRLAYDGMEKNKNEVKTLKKDLADLTSKFSVERAYRIHLDNSLKHFLSKAQRDIVLGRSMGQRKKVVWSFEDISNALAIRNISKECYIYLRKQLKYPLPDISTLQRLATKLNE